MTRFDGSSPWERGEPEIGNPRYTNATHASHANDTPWGPEVDAQQDAEADAEWNQRDKHAPYCYLFTHDDDPNASCSCQVTTP